MIRDTISAHIKDAMRARDQVRLDALRYFWSQVRNAEIDAKAELDDAAVIALLTREVKRRNEAIDQMKASGRDQMVLDEQAKLEVLKVYLPPQMTKADLEVIVKEVIESGETEFGKVMGLVMAKVKGQADGALVQEVVKATISKS